MYSRKGMYNGERATISKGTTPQTAIPKPKSNPVHAGVALLVGGLVGAGAMWGASKFIPGVGSTLALGTQSASSSSSGGTSASQSYSLSLYRAQSSYAASLDKAAAAITVTITYTTNPYPLNLVPTPVFTWNGPKGCPGGQCIAGAIYTLIAANGVAQAILNIGVNGDGSVLYVVSNLSGSPLTVNGGPFNANQSIAAGGSANATAPSI